MIFFLGGNDTMFGPAFGRKFWPQDFVEASGGAPDLKI